MSTLFRFNTTNVLLLRLLLLLFIVVLVMCVTLFNTKFITASLISLINSSSITKYMCSWLLGLVLIIAIANLISMIGYSSCMLSQYLITLSLSILSFIALRVWSLSRMYELGILHIVPVGTPAILLTLLTVVELTSYSVRLLTLSLRLTANIIAGHTLIALIGVLSELGIGINIVLYLLEFIVCVVQSLVFVLLLLRYIIELN